MSLERMTLTKDMLQDMRPQLTFRISLLYQQVFSGREAICTWSTGPTGWLIFSPD